MYVHGVAGAHTFVSARIQKAIPDFEIGIITFRSQQLATLWCAVLGQATESQTDYLTTCCPHTWPTYTTDQRSTLLLFALFTALLLHSAP